MRKKAQGARLPQILEYYRRELDKLKDNQKFKT